MSERHSDNKSEFAERERLAGEILSAGNDILDRKLGYFTDETQLITDLPNTYRMSVIPIEGLHSLHVAGPLAGERPLMALSVNYYPLSLDILSDGTLGKFERVRFSAVAGGVNWQFTPVNDEELRAIHEQIMWAQMTAEPLSDEDWEM
jgi:hypothetical protein